MTLIALRRGGVELDLVGDPAIAEAELHGMLTSRDTPPDLRLPTLDVAVELGRRGAAVVGGFHAPLERDFLDLLLLAGGRGLLLLGRSVADFHPPKGLRLALEDGRLTIASGSGERDVRRVDRRAARRRNLLLVDLASSLFLPFAGSGGQAEGVARRAMDDDIPIWTIDHPGNHDLILLGGRPLPGLALSSSPRSFDHDHGSAD